MVDPSEFSDTKPHGLTESSLARVASLANRLVDLDEQIAECEAELKRLNEQRDLIAEGELPEAMDACGDRGLSSFTLDGGYKVSVAVKFRCGQLDDLPDDLKRPERRSLQDRLSALQWLSDHGHGDLARRTITITLGKASAEVEEKIRAYFESLRLNSARYAAANVVPWNSLSAFARDLDSRATPEDPVPLDELGVQKVRVAVVKHPKAKDEL